MFFKRLSRSRGNSYVEDDYQRSPTDAAARPPSSYQSPGQVVDDQLHDNPASPQDPSKDPDHMYNQSSSQGYSAGATRPLQPQGPGGVRGGGAGANRAESSTRDSGYADATPMSPAIKGADQPIGASGATGSGGLSAHGPDLLTAAFNQAVKPYTEKIEMLEQQLADMQDWISQQEQQRMEIFRWIDQRGLRPDVPPGIAKQMDETSDAAFALNAQLDRKITIVNFDLHRLQDDLNDSISSAHFASAMGKFIPDIERLAALHSGPKYAYELLIKLVGNLNSHGGLEALNGDKGADAEIEEDSRARSAFYSRMDEELIDVVQRRCQERDDSWGKGGIQGEIKRLERNGAYLRNLGVDSYFPRSLELMKREAAGGVQAGGMQGAFSQGPSPPSYSH